MRDPLAKLQSPQNHGEGRGGGEVVQPPSFFHSSYRIGEGEVWMELERRSVQYMYVSPSSSAFSNFGTTRASRDRYHMLNVSTEMQENAWARLRESRAPGCESRILAHIFSCISVV